MHNNIIGLYAYHMGLSLLLGPSSD